MDLYLLFQKCQILLLFPDFSLINDLDGEKLPRIRWKMPEVYLASIANSQQILLLIFVLFYFDAALGDSGGETLIETKPHGLGEIQDLWSIQFAFPVIFPWKIHLLSILWLNYIINSNLSLPKSQLLTSTGNSITTLKL